MSAIDRHEMSPYPADPPFEEYTSFASYHAASPNNGFSPALGSQEYSAILDAFTNNANDEYSPEQPVHSTNPQSNNSYSSQMTSAYNSAFIPDQSVVSNGPFGSTQAEYSPTSTMSYGPQISPSAPGGLGIVSNNPALGPSAQANYNAMLTSSHRPNSQTVSHLEALVDAAPTYTPSFASHRASIASNVSDLSASRLGRQASAQSFLDGPHLSTLSLNSPRNSVSGGSSAPSSSQNSPVTPLSAYSQEGLSFQAQQQQRQMASQNYNYVYPDQQYHGVQHHIAHPQHARYSPAQALSMSTPASFSAGGGYEKSHTSLARTQQGRMSSAGLMDQIVSSRRAVISPVSTLDSTNMTNNSKVRRKSRSISKSTTPPALPTTPGRQLAHANMATAVASQTASSAGPHRTPAKRNSLHDGNAQYVTMTSNTSATTPKRPGTLRRTASHTPGSTSTPAETGPVASGLASPADFHGVAQRAQNAAQFALASAMQPAHKARIAESAGLEFPGTSAGMTRARSSPGLTLLNQPTNAWNQLEPSALSPLSTSTSSRKARSNTFSNLHMSPLGPPRNSMAATGSGPVSYAEALSAADQLTAFLSHQATLITPNGKDTVLNVLGTYEQLQAIGDIRTRVANRLSGQ